jgi:hypothetical protein
MPQPARRFHGAVPNLSIAMIKVILSKAQLTGIMRQTNRTFWT